MRQRPLFLALAAVIAAIVGVGGLLAVLNLGSDDQPPAPAVTTPATAPPGPAAPTAAPTTAPPVRPSTVVSACAPPGPCGS